MFVDSPRSESPQLEMDRLLDDDASPSAASQNQMIILANQIIAAMPDRIKQSPAQAMEDNSVPMEVNVKAARSQNKHSGFVAL